MSLSAEEPHREGHTGKLTDNVHLVLPVLKRDAEANVFFVRVTVSSLIYTESQNILSGKDPPG